jgi:hypothetical protein
MLKQLQILFVAFTLAVLTVGLLHSQYPAGPYANVYYITSNTAADTATLSAQNMIGLLTGTPTAAANYTTPTATALCGLFPALASQNSASFTWPLDVKNTSAGANTITMVAGAGVTLSGTGTIAQNNVRRFEVTANNCGGTPAVTLFSLQAGAF